MALITVGSVEDFAVVPSPEVRREKPIARGIASARAVTRTPGSELEPRC